MDDGSSISVDVAYLAAGANRQTAVADWSKRGTIAFGAGANIALWRPGVSEALACPSSLG